MQERSAAPLALSSACLGSLSICALAALFLSLSFQILYHSFPSLSSRFQVSVLSSSLADPGRLRVTSTPLSRWFTQVPPLASLR